MTTKFILAISVLCFTLVILTIPIAASTDLLISKQENKTNEEFKIDSIDIVEQKHVDSVKLGFYFEKSNVFKEHWEINKLGVYPRNKKLNVKGFIKAFNYNQSFCFPVKTHITSKFGKRWGRMHNGIDIALKTGDSVVCAFDGKVRFATNNHNGFGKLIIIRHPNGLETYYAHLSKIDVVPNQIVKAGEYIGKGGRTGRVTGPHLHFETRYKGKPINPLHLIDQRSLALQ